METYGKIVFESNILHTCNILTQPIKECTCLQNEFFQSLKHDTYMNKSLIQILGKPCS